MKRLPTSKFQRAKKLFGAAAKAAGKGVVGKLKDFDSASKLQTRISQAKEFVDALGELKGSAMKLGQMLSLQGEDFLPDEIREVFTKLQNKTTGMDFEEVSKILEEELKEKFSELESISKDPIAAASIGQVHRAKIFNEDVAIKIQYPEISKTVDTDLQILSKGLKGISFLKGAQMDFDPLIEEIRETLHLEADYLNEVSNLKRFYKNFENSPDYKVPKPFPDFSTSKIITMEFMEGVELNHFFNNDVPLQIRQEIGDRVMRLYLDEFYRYGFVQTDPNFGNFLIDKDHKIILLDFGSCKFFEKEFVELYQKFCRAAMEGNKALSMEYIYKINPRFELESDEAKNIFWDMLQYSFSPFQKQNQPYFFLDKNYDLTIKKMSLQFVAKVKYSIPPRQLIFLHRKLGGVYRILQKLNISLDLFAYMEQYVFSNSIPFEG